MRTPSEEFARKNCTKVGCAHVLSGGQECRHCGFDAEELQRRKSLPLVALPNGLHGKVIPRETELRGNWGLAFEPPNYYLACSVCGEPAKDQIHGDAICGSCGAKMTIRWMREDLNNEKEASN